jgi:uncharacterized membrane protein YgcG
MALNILLATLFGKIIGKQRTSRINTPETMFGVGGGGINNQQIFLPTIGGGFITLQRQWFLPLEKINNWLAQIHAIISRSSISINSPLLRIWNMLERLFRTLFIPLELFLSSFLLPLIPVLRTVLRLSMATLLPMAVEFFKIMMENKDAIAKFLTGEMWFELLFGKKKETTSDEMEQLKEITDPWAMLKNKMEEEQNQSKSIWDEIWDWLSGKKILSDIKSAFENNESAKNVKQNVNDSVINPVVNFIGNFKIPFNSPFVQNIKNGVQQNMINPVVNYIGNFASAILTNPVVVGIKQFVWSNLVMPVINFISEYSSAIINHPIVIGIKQFVWNNLIMPVINFVSNYASGILQHPVVIGIKQFINANIVEPVSNFISTIKSKFDEFVRNLPSPLNEIWNAINNLFNEIRNKINSFISSITFGIFSVSGGGGGSKTSSGTSSGTTSTSTSSSSSGRTSKGGGPAKGPAIPLQHGGLLLEPVFGIGLMTGRRYTLAEREPELVAPLNKMQTTSGITININVNGNIIGINDFENRIKQIIEMELRRVK